MSMALFIYYLLLFILLNLLLFFVIPIYITVRVDVISLKVTVFRIPVFTLRGEKFYRFIKNKVPKNRAETKQMYNFLDLVHYVHFTKIAVIQSGHSHDPIDVMIYGFLSIINSSVPLDKLNYTFEEGPANVIIRGNFTCNLGIILINFFIIRRENNVETIVK